MNVPSRKPSDSDREFLQAELTRLVGQGRLDLTTYQDLVDIVWSTDNNTDLMQIRARYFGGPPVQQQGSPVQPMPQVPPVPPQPGPQYYQQSPQQPPAQHHQNYQYGQPNQPPHPHAPDGIPMGQHLGHPQQYTPAPHQDVEQSTMSSIKKSGEWVVPGYSAYKLNGSDLHLDLRRATASAPVVTIDISMNMSAATIVVPPGVHVDVQIASKNWSEFHVDTTNPIPGAPRVILTGVSRASTLKVITKSPNEPLGFWEQVFGK